MIADDYPIARDPAGPWDVEVRLYDQNGEAFAFRCSWRALPTLQGFHSYIIHGQNNQQQKEPTTERTKMSTRQTKWELLTKRTNEPKLNYIEYRLDEIGINYKRDGESFHAPCLYVDARHSARAWALLNEKWSKTGDIGPNQRGRTALDDIPDDDPRFNQWDWETWGDDSTPQQMGWVGQDGRP